MSGPSWRVRRAVKCRSHGRCEFPMCGLPGTDMHHRYERGMGGFGPKSPAATWINGTANLLHSCAQHNQWATNVDPNKAHDMGWIIREVDGDVPAPWLVPVMTVHFALPVYLSDVDAQWAMDVADLPETEPSEELGLHDA